ncbi:hypothetical protein BGX30_003197, partial [Mortierella sp. GBA39]
MTEDRLNLLCLDDGEPQSNVFSVKATPTDTVDDLRVLISAKRLGIDTLSKDLTLWRVSIPDDDDDDEIPVVLDNVINKDQKKLRTTRELSDVWKDKPPKGTIHVIIQRPPRANIDQPNGVVNGAIATVTALSRMTIAVRLEKSKKLIKIPKHTQETLDGKQACIQFPLTLAYAITVHRVQALTLDRVTLDRIIFDLNKTLQAVRHMSQLAMIR